jgi:hypothetical protein
MFPCSLPVATYAIVQPLKHDVRQLLLLLLLLVRYVWCGHRNQIS